MVVPPQDVDLSLQHVLSDTTNLAGSKRKRGEEGKVMDSHVDDGNDGGWQVVTGKKNKRARASSQARPLLPSITFAAGQCKLDNKLKVFDLRNLVLYILADGIAPNWLSIANKAHVPKIISIFAPGLEEGLFKDGANLFNYTSPASPDFYHPKAPVSPDDYYPRKLVKGNLTEELKIFADMFSKLWPVRCPGNPDWGVVRCPVDEFLTAPIARKDREAEKIQRSLDWKTQKTPITDFLMAPDKIHLTACPIHPVLLDEEARKDFKPEEGIFYTNISGEETANVVTDEASSDFITQGRQVLALDCEMVCLSEAGGGKYNDMAIARVSIVDWDGNIRLDTFVKPPKPVVNYLTRFSGITEEHLRNVTTTLADIHKEFESLITSNTIVVGHQIDSDFSALRLAHPFCVDTTVLYPHTLHSRRHKLKDLALQHLNREIQNNAEGHDSIEDARAALDLVKLKCQKGKQYGLPDKATESLFTRLQKCGKTGVLVDTDGRTFDNIGPGHTLKFKYDSDEEVTTAAERAIRGDSLDSSEAEIPVGGADFVFAGLRELERFRGWSRAKPRKNDGSNTPDDTQNEKQEALEPVDISAVVTRLAARIRRIYDAAPPGSLFLVFSGRANPLEQQRLFARRQQLTRPGGNGSLWCGSDIKLLARATDGALNGMGFIDIKKPLPACS